MEPKFQGGYRRN